MPLCFDHLQNVKYIFVFAVLKKEKRKKKGTHKLESELFESFCFLDSNKKKKIKNLNEILL